MSHLIQRTVVTSWDSRSVFDYLLDFSHAPEWDAGTVTCRRTSGDGGIGTTYENVSEFRGNKTTLEYTVEKVEDGTSFVITGRNKTVTSQDTIALTPTDDGGTSVDYSAEMTFHGIAKLASPFLGGALRNLGDDAEKSLRDALEKHADQVA